MAGEQRIAKPESNTTADKLLDTVKNDGDTTAFQDQINSMSHEERLNLVTDLNKNTILTNPDTDTSIHIDAHTDKESGKFIDIDIVKLEGQPSEGNYKEKRVDLYTPGENGKAFDKEQEVNKAVSPYDNLRNLMNEVRPGELNKESNEAQVTKLIEKHNADNPNKNDMVERFKTPYAEREEGKHKPFDGVSSVLADGRGWHPNAPDEVKDMLDDFLVQKNNKPTYDNDISIIADNPVPTSEDFIELPPFPDYKRD